MQVADVFHGLETLCAHTACGACCRSDRGDGLAACLLGPDVPVNIACLFQGADQDGDGDMDLGDVARGFVDGYFSCTPQTIAPEVCDGRDNDRNGLVDDGLGQTICGLDEVGLQVTRGTNYSRGILGGWNGPARLPETTGITVLLEDHT
jgi:hypothetical protein